MSENSGFRQGMQVAFRLGTELTVATIIGGLLGYALDTFSGTKPWGYGGRDCVWFCSRLSCCLPGCDDPNCRRRRYKQRFGIIKQTMESPLHHFEVHTIIPIPHIGGLDLSINNAVVAMWVGLAIIGSMFIFPARKGLSLVPGRLQSVLEIAVEFIRNLVYEFIGERRGYENMFHSLLVCFCLFLPAT